MLRGVFSKWQHSRVSQLCWYAYGRRGSSWRSQSYQEYPFKSLESSQNPQIPLCERPATWTSTKEDVCSWYREALDGICVVGNSLHVDGGPSREDLELELQWIMEDAVVGWKDGQLPGNHDGVPMRISLHELGALF